MMIAMPLRRPPVLLALLTFLALASSSCGKRYVDFSVTNNTAIELHAVEINYPGGSFGTTKLAPGQTFHYHFKSLQNGKLKLGFEGPGHKWISSDGPAWSQGHGGNIQTTINADSRVQWETSGG